MKDIIKYYFKFELLFYILKVLIVFLFLDDKNLVIKMLYM